ncbi:SET domain-containing protein, partial [Coemansia reversa NRRL 1564]
MDTGDNSWQLQKFQDWLEANGATLVKLELRECGQHGNGVYARETIRDNEQYANIPSDLIITSAVCRKELKDVLSADLSGRALLCAFLIHQRFVCTESFWKPYIDILPQTFHTPLHFTTQELLLLHGTPMEYAVEDRRSELCAEHKRVQEAVDSKADEMRKVLDFDNYLWAATVVSSRAFTKALLNVGREDISDTKKDNLNQGNTGAKASVLLPLLDMMNHRPQARITWLVDSDSGSISFVAGSDVTAGSEVANNYGAKSNEELLLGYGFCASSNPLNCYHIKL